MISNKIDYMQVLVDSQNSLFQLDREDYLGDDGLMYCGKCRTRRQKVQKAMGREYIVPVNCKCRSEEYEQAERLKNLEKIEKIRQSQLCEEKYRLMTFERSDCELKVARNYVTSWETMLEQNIGLLFYGETGTGKTYAASAIANAIIDKSLDFINDLTFMDYSVYMSNTASLVHLMSDTKGDGYSFCMSRLSRSALVVIDDFGIERNSDYVNEKIFEIIEKRVESNKPTIVTTNIDIHTMMKAQSLHEKRIFSRLLSLQPVAFEGEDRRMKDMKNKRAEIKNLLGI